MPPLGDYNETTFVAYLDISGFMNMMQRNTDDAWDALNHFYNAGYEAINRQQEHPKLVQGIFVSDCAILFIRNQRNPIQSFKHLLNLVKTINRKMREKKLMLTTSIVYDRFKYENRDEGLDTQKAPIFGFAYTRAYHDERSSPKLLPGQCRVIAKGLPNEIKDRLNQPRQRSNENILNYLVKLDLHYYFYWSATNPKEIREIQRWYEEYGEEQYDLLFRIIEGTYSHDLGRL